MDSNLKLLWAAFGVASFMFAGCSNDNDIPPVGNITIVEEGGVKPAQKAGSTQPTAILGSGGSMSGQLSQTFTNIVAPEKAKHVIVACAEMDVYKEELVAAYKRGAVITVADPDGTRLDDWCASQNMVFSGDPTGMDRYSLVSFNRKAVSMSVQKLDPVDGIDEGEVPLVIFTGWLDGILTPNLKGPDFRSKDIKKRFAPQNMSHVFPIHIPVEKIQDAGWGVPENMSFDATAEFSYEIYPLHSFVDNASSEGDYYVVEGDLTVHNGDLYNGRWQYTQGKSLYESCGFCLESCGIEVNMLERGASGLALSGEHRFAAGPAPESVSGSSTYQVGFDWAFEGWLTGGNGLESSTPTPLQQGGWTWSNRAENLLSGFDIENVADGGKSTWRLVMGLPEDNEGKVPETATGDLKFHYSWIWAVPQAKDNTPGRYYMQVEFKPVYRLTRCSLPGSKMDYKELVPEIVPLRFMMIPPSRVEGQRL